MTALRATLAGLAITVAMVGGLLYWALIDLVREDHR